MDMHHEEHSHIFISGLPLLNNTMPQREKYHFKLVKVAHNHQPDRGRMEVLA